LGFNFWICWANSSSVAKPRGKWGQHPIFRRKNRVLSPFSPRIYESEVKKFVSNVINPIRKSEKERCVYPLNVWICYPSLCSEIGIDRRGASGCILSEVGEV